MLTVCSDLAIVINKHWETLLAINKHSKMPSSMKIVCPLIR